MLAKMEPKTEKIVNKRGEHPKAAGLWNLCVREVGLLQCSTFVVDSPINPVENTDAMSATVVATVTLRPYIGRYYPTAENAKIDKVDEDQRLLSEDEFTFEGACNIGKYNTCEEGRETPFHLFAVATAESIATGRALKKALAINCHTAEEIAADLDKLKGFNLTKPPTEMITAGQKKAISKKAEEIELNLEKYLEGDVGVNLFEFEGSQLTKEQAEKILTDLNNWAINPKKIKKEYKNV